MKNNVLGLIASLNGMHERGQRVPALRGPEVATPEDRLRVGRALIGSWGASASIANEEGAAVEVGVVAGSRGGSRRPGQRIGGALRRVLSWCGVGGPAKGSLPWIGRRPARTTHWPIH